MERPQFIKKYNPYRFLIIFYSVGLAGHLVPFTRDFMLLLTPLALLISFITIIIPFIQNSQCKVFGFIILCGIAGYFAEIVGVNSGILFGQYTYGITLGPGIACVPFAMILNWIIIFTGSISLAEIFFKNKTLIIISASVFSVLFDYLIEPVAVIFKYWSWEGNQVPIKNYITWGILIFIFSIIFVLLKLKVKTRLPAFLFVIQLIYFFIFRITLFFNIL